LPEGARRSEAAARTPRRQKPINAHNRQQMAYKRA
jgi:hypothetical protein